MSRVEPFWPMPRWLSRAVDRGELSQFQFTLVCYLGGRGLEHHGVDVTLGELASTFTKSEKWVSMSLRSLRDEAHLIDYELRQGQKSKFHVTAGQALRSGVSALYFKPTTSQLTSEVAPPSGPTSEVTSEATSVSQFRGDLGSRGGGEAAQPESVSGFAERPTSEVGRGDKNENENRKPLAPTERLVRDTSTGVSHRGGAGGDGVVSHQGAVSPTSPPASVHRRPVTEHLLAAELLAAFPGATEVVLDDDGWTTVAEGPYGTLAIRDLPPDRGVPDDALWEALG